MNGKVVLDPDNQRDVQLFAEVEWDLSAVTGRPFESLSTNLRVRLLASAEATLRAVAERQKRARPRAVA